MELLGMAREQPFYRTMNILRIRQRTPDMLDGIEHSTTS